MKYAYICIAAVLLLGGGYLVATSITGDTKDAVQEEAPVGYHRMPDGTLMRNDAGTEGMGALSELQEQQYAAEQEGEAGADIGGRIIEVRGVNHTFDVQEIRVKKGETVTVNFESAEGFHDWVLDEFDAQTEKVQPGTKTSVTFVADETGTFEYYCSVGSHREQGMVGKLIVEG